MGSVAQQNRKSGLPFSELCGAEPKTAAAFFCAACYSFLLVFVLRAHVNRLLLCNSVSGYRCCSFVLAVAVKEYRMRAFASLMLSRI